MEVPVYCGSVSERLDFFCGNFQEPTAIPSRNKGGRCARGWCVRRGSLLQDRLPVKFQDVKFKDPNFKH